MSLTERRAADRAKMAEQVIALVRRHGFAAYVDEEMTLDRELWVRIKTARGLSLTLDFDGASTQPDTYVLSWHGVEDPHKLSSGFAPSVNQYHWHKATDICEGFESLMDTLDRRLTSIASGEAFQCL